MQKTYDPVSIESAAAALWQQRGVAVPKLHAVGPSYCIVIPPPNVTGNLHMGHAFQNSLIDALIRYHKMCGADTLFQVGTDHAGISTQMVVTRQLAQQQLSRHELGRTAFVERIWEWKHTYGSIISEQLRRLGVTADWQRARFTLDHSLSQAVTKVFVQLYREGLIYKKQKLVNWDPSLQSAISDLEVVHSEEMGQMWYIKYPVVGQDRYVVVATTRPETLLADMAVAVHPEDARYQADRGVLLALPLTDRQIPLIFDEMVDPTFASGCVKITPAHDFNDYQVAMRHQLAFLNILNVDGTLNAAAPPAYRGLDRLVARQQIVRDLEAAGLLVKVEAHMLKVPRCEQTQVIIEPYLTDQWFLKMTDLAQAAQQAVHDGRLVFVPEQWTKVYLDWLANIEDWCISRQLWWGHRIPVWYGPDATVYVGDSEAAVRAEYNLSAALPLVQDEDVLDTWFSSALWPFAALGWPNVDAEDFAKFYPSNVLVTGFDIIFFWVARMVMLALKFTGQVPFRTVFIHGLLQDHEGKKMSKSKGNVIDPLDIIDGITLERLLEKRTQALLQPKMAEKIIQTTKQLFPEGIQAFGVDALRFAFYQLATNTKYISFDLKRVEAARNFCNKLWNASRYILGSNALAITFAAELSIIDQWILSRWQQVKSKVAEYIAQYRFDFVVQALYEFVWYEFCDWYLEFTKGAPCNIARALWREMITVLHPFLPFLTEALWALMKDPNDAACLLEQAYPQPDMMRHDANAEAVVSWLQRCILGLRNLRSEYRVPPQQSIIVYVVQHGAHELAWLRTYGHYVQQLARVAAWHELDASAAAAMQGVATVSLGEVQFLVQLAGMIDITAEKQRITRLLEKLQQEQQKLTDKLANAAYLAKAPAAVVEKDRQALATLGSERETLVAALHALG
jgi:valyl-tRNA synthetase